MPLGVDEHSEEMVLQVNGKPEHFNVSPQCKGTRDILSLSFCSAKASVKTNKRGHWTAFTFHLIYVVLKPSCCLWLWIICNSGTGSVQSFRRISVSALSILRAFTFTRTARYSYYFGKSTTLHCDTTFNSCHLYCVVEKGGNSSMLKSYQANT